MSTIPCPKCSTYISVIDEDRQLFNYTLHCRLCGYMKVFQEESAFDTFLTLRRPKMNSWSVIARDLENRILKLRQELRETPKLEVVVEEVQTEKPLIIKIEPTLAQKRRGATHPVNCSCCGTVTFRRKGELKKSKIFFCQKSCRKEYQSSL